MGVALGVGDGWMALGEGGNMQILHRSGDAVTNGDMP